MSRTMTLWLQGQESSWLKDISYMFSFPERGGRMQEGGWGEDEEEEEEEEEEGGKEGGNGSLMRIKKS